MTSQTTKAALDQSSRKAHLGEPHSPPNNTTRAKMNAMRAPEGFTPKPPTSLRQFDAPGVDPGPIDLDHHQLGQRLAAKRNGNRT